MSRSSSGPGRWILNPSTAGSIPPRDATHALASGTGAETTNLGCGGSTPSRGTRPPRSRLRCGIAAPRLRTEGTWFDSTRRHCEDGATAARRAHNPLPHGRVGSIPALATPTSLGRAERFIRASVGVRFPSSALERRPAARTAAFEAAYPGSNPGAPSPGLGPRWAACFGSRTSGEFDSRDPDQ